MNKVNTKIISIINQKGGVGKTTTACNLSFFLGLLNKKTLVLDLDPQGNLSTSLGVDNEDRYIGMYEVLSGLSDIRESIIKISDNLDIISANVNLSAIQIEAINKSRREYILKNAIEKISSKYDFILIDCPPSLGILSINALVCSEYVIIPSQSEFLSLEGLSHLIQTIKLIQINYNKNLSILGILITMYDRRNKLSDIVVNDIKNCLPNLLFENMIPRTVKLAEAPSHGKPIAIYDPKSIGALAYERLANEVLRKVSKMY